jgi:hypothetical protein
MGRKANGVDIVFYGRKWSIWGGVESLGSSEIYDIVILVHTILQPSEE